MYSPASRKVRNIKPSGVVIGTWKARDYDITSPLSPIRHAERNRSGHRSLTLILIWASPIGVLLAGFDPNRSLAITEAGVVGATSGGFSLPIGYQPHANMPIGFGFPIAGVPCPSLSA